MRINLARRREAGSIVVVVLTLLVIMLLLVLANVRMVTQLRREIKLVEKQQLAREGFSTNQPAAHSPK
ncbi:MAG TPA: hypothetical protein VHB20_16270 [Verrucomicrobiae bacterium]|jgi:Tfp pilus assembly protein PilX|nr:hypothetical protein [Verrucomicrobiae bacterium]